MLPTTLNGWLAHIERTHPSAISMGLERVREVWTRLELQPDFPVIVVGGTNGKGSTCAMLEAILSNAGYRVGCYTSPHLLRYNERVRVNGREASDATICRSFEVIERGRGDTALTYFEFGTLAAMAMFMEESLDVAILEVGLGGRFDAVNLFDNECAVITSVDIDHVEYLGHTRDAIGREKAGILRKGIPAVFADRHMPMTVLEHAADVGARVIRVGQDYDYAPCANGWQFSRRGGDTLTLPMPSLYGAEQLSNASAALAALEALADRLTVTTAAVHQGLLGVRLDGRFQWLRRNPDVIVDVAHNPHAAAALSKKLDQVTGGKKFIALFAMLADKDIRGVIHAVAGQIAHWLVATIHAPRGASAETLQTALAAEGVNDPVTAFTLLSQAYAEALEMARASGRPVIVFGSFHTVGEALRCHAAPGTAENPNTFAYALPSPGGHDAETSAQGARRD